jgi:hypothetical protein
MVAGVLFVLVGVALSNPDDVALLGPIAIVVTSARSHRCVWGESYIAEITICAFVLRICAETGAP